MAISVHSKIDHNPISRELYQLVMAKLADLGPYTVEPKQTSLHLTNGHRAFLGVYARSNGLLLSIVSDRLMHSPRFKKAEQLSRSRFHYDVLVTDITEIDSELLGWIEASYRL